MSGVNDETLMTLAGIAYGAPENIGEYLAAAAPTKGWQVNWIPEVEGVPDNFMFMATDGSGQYVVAIRGTYPNPFSEAYWHDGSQDSPFGDMVNWPGATGAKISAGTNTGFTNLVQLTEESGKTLLDKLAELPTSATVTVTGHSLGGTLTPVLALHISTSCNIRVNATSYAGLTPGNEDFAALFGSGTALEGKIRRVYNTLDSVSYGWDRVWATHDFYQPAPEGGSVVSALLLATEARLKLGGYDYAAVGTAVPLDGVLKKPTIPCDLVAYVLENLHQHMPDTYLSLLGAPPLPFSIIWGTMTVPRDHAAAGVAAAPGGPVVHIG